MQALPLPMQVNVWCIQNPCRVSPNKTLVPLSRIRTRDLQLSPFCSFLAFVFERGRVILRLNTTDVQCKTVSFKKAAFESGRGSVYVQTSINFFNYSGDFIHDAAVTWVENVNINTFEVCALKAGRAERLTPDGGLTFVDFVAFQECPVGAIAGRLQMPSNWWDGTTCKTVAFEKVRHNISSFIRGK